MKSIFVLIGLTLGIVFFGLVFLENLGGGKDKPLVEINSVRFSVEIARTLAEREKGLSGRDNLKENEGMLFIFEEPGLYGFWMKEMKLPLDIIWIRDDRIVGFSENVQPQIGANEAELKIYYPPEPVQKVLEISAGEAKRRGLKIGDFVRF